MKYIFSEKQFATLLCIDGVTGLLLFSLEQPEDEVQIVQTIKELYDMKRIVRNGERFEVAEPFRSALAVIRQADHLVKIEFPEQSTPPQLLFPGKNGNCVILERSREASGSLVKLQQKKQLAYVYSLLKSEYLPQCIELNSENDDWFREAELPQLAQKTLVRISRISTHRTDRTATLEIVEQPPLKWIKKTDSDERILYSEQAVTKSLLGMIGGKEI